MWNLLIFSLCFVAINASGEFSVVKSSDSIIFKGNSALKSEFVGDVLTASVGNTAHTNAEWDAYYIINPFEMPMKSVAVFVDGVKHLDLDSETKTFELLGNFAGPSIDFLSSELEASDIAICDINFNKIDEAKINFQSCFGDVSLPAIKKTQELKPELHTGDKAFLESMPYFEAADIFKMKKSTEFVIFRISLEAIAQAHGENSAAMSEATKLVTDAILKLKAVIQKNKNKDSPQGNNEVLLVVISDKYTPRAKRAVEGPNADDNRYNLAEYYNEDYPVIFNIILWFMVTFGFSLLAICYAIGSMDPGRDSIIYRMTSTRMKKDN